jgi:hypothetical protein
MLDQVKVLQKTIEENRIGYISNYKNINGYPLAYNGSNMDAYGNDRSQSAPGYIDVNKSDFRYFADGLLVSILEENEAYYKVSTPAFDGEYFIPKKYVSFKNAPEQLKKVIVIDELNQNEGVFEWSIDKWKLISYIYATTGVESKYSFVTPKGHFMAIQKKPYFLYLEDGTTRISGFAPFAVRFSAGGYIHGVPIDFSLGQNQSNTSPLNPLNHKEYLFTVGTTPRHEIDGVMQSAVRRGLARRKLEAIKQVGVDETSFQKRHEYVTVVSDLQRSRVLQVADDRKAESLDGF